MTTVALTDEADTPAGDITPDYEVVIIGAGFGGIGAGVELQRKGISDFIMIEKWGAVGGTWHANKYPGVAVDIPTFIYSFSYEQKTSWSSLFTPGAELEEYANEMVDKYNLRQRLRLNTTVTSNEFDEANNLWRIFLDGGEVITARFVINACGGLEQPKMPEIEGLDSYKGKLMHTALWDNDFDIKGKRVAVIGTGATSLQLVPSIAPEVGHLTVFQRTPIYVLPKADLKYNWFLRAFFGFPGVARGIRVLMDVGTAYTPDALYKAPSKYVEAASMAMAKGVRRWMRTQIDDPETREKLMPYYGFGCKRPSMSAQYLKTYNRPNVSLVTESIQRITEKGVVTADGVEHEVDVLVCATGFSIWDSMPGFPVTGRRGKDLKSFFLENGYQAYQGASIPDYPNMFTILGPYGYVFGPYHWLVEATSAHAARAIAETKKRAATTCEVKLDVHNKYHQKMRMRNMNHLWLSPACATSNTYYIDNHGDSPFRPSGLGEMTFHNKFYNLDNYQYSTETVAPPVVTKASGSRRRAKRASG